MFKNKKVLVTGGTGMVGRELVQLLHDRGAIIKVVSLDELTKNSDYITLHVPINNNTRNLFYTTTPFI